MAEMCEASLEHYRIPDAPLSMFYIPSFIAEEEEIRILNKIPSNRWISLSHRRLQAIPARLTATNTLVASGGLPEWLLEPVVHRIDELGIFKDSPHRTVNHCLINEYVPGQGIMPHEDGSAYFPVVATVSLGSSMVLDVVEKVSDNQASNSDVPDTPKSWRIFQEPRSLLLTTGSAYTETLHGIAEVETDENLNNETVANWDLLRDKKSILAADGKSTRQTRISLTFRDVLRVSSIGSKIFGKPKG